MSSVLEEQKNGRPSVRARLYPPPRHNRTADHRTALADRGCRIADEREDREDRELGPQAAGLRDWPQQRGRLRPRGDQRERRADERTGSPPESDGPGDPAHGRPRRRGEEGRRSDPDQAPDDFRAPSRQTRVAPAAAAW